MIIKPEFTLKQEGELPLLNPVWDDVQKALLQINPQSRSFYTLSRTEGDYVQVAGAPLRVIVEFRQTDVNSFSHYVLGRRSSDIKLVSINYSGGAITLQRNEVLQLSDAIIIFSSFMQSDSMPPEYNLRDVTSQFDP